MKDDGWILQIEELNTQDAEACFVSYFQLRNLEIKIMFPSPFFFKKKSKKPLFSSEVMSFLSYASFLCSKTRLLPFAYMPDFQCHMSKSYSQLLILSPIRYTWEKQQLFQVQGLWIFFFNFHFKTFYSKSKSSKFGNTLYFLMSCN